MGRGIDFTRHQRERAINRKADFLRNARGEETFKSYTGGGEQIGRLSKAKIFCSCGVCRPDRSRPSFSEKRAVKAADSQLSDL